MNAQNPGPGTFKITQDWTKHKRGASFGNSKRNDEFASKSVMVPGPADYDL